MSNYRTHKSRAFTLIELLVVIAIIAILAAILFPVFAQAKTAAKKATSISNQKQIATGLLLYANDADDKYPRNDGCQQYSSLNSALNVAGAVSGDGCSGGGPFAYRLNHYAWQKWLQPYTKSVDLFWSPAFGKVDPRNLSGTRQWSQNGQMYSSYALNLSLTGALNTWARSSTSNGYSRNSFTGGSQTGIGDTAKAFLTMELVSTEINFAPVITYPNAPEQTAYPAAIRELWVPMFKKPINASSCQFSNDTDPTTVPFSGKITLGMADGHATTYDVDKFLAETPPTGASGYLGSKTWSCAPTGGAWTTSGAPTWYGSWPLWAIQ